MIDIPKNRAGISVISIEIKIVNILRLYKNRKKSKENKHGSTCVNWYKQIRG